MIISQNPSAIRQFGKGASTQTAGYSLLEILGVLAMITMVAGIGVAAFAGIVVSAESKPWETLFREAVQEARIEAAASGETILLLFDDHRGEFRLVSDSNTGLSMTDPLDVAAGFQGDSGRRNRNLPQVAFYPQLAASSGRSGFRDVFSSTAVPHLVFHPSGAATPARILFRYADGRESILTLDPFSHGPIPERSRRL